MDANIIGPATLSIGQGLSTFNSFLPKLSEVRRASISDNPDMAADVRLGEVAAGAVTVGIGVIASGLTQSNIPVITAVIVTLLLVIIYESTLRATRPFEPSILPVVVQGRTEQPVEG